MPSAARRKFTASGMTMASFTNVTGPNWVWFDAEAVSQISIERKCERFG